MNEYIDRKVVLIAIKNSCSNIFKVASTAGRMHQAIDQVVESIPSADVAPVVHARWADGSHGDAKCPVCGREDMERNYNYCPHCGAKMDE